MSSIGIVFCIHSPHVILIYLKIIIETFFLLSLTFDAIYYLIKVNHSKNDFRYTELGVSGMLKPLFIKIKW